VTNKKGVQLKKTNSTELFVRNSNTQQPGVHEVVEVSGRHFRQST